MLTRARKEELCAELRTLFAEMPTVFVVEPAPMPVGVFDALRIEVRKGGGSVRMVKNTLARRALEGTACAGILEHFAQTSVLIAGSDSLALAKAVDKFRKETEDDFLSFKGGVIDGAVVDFTTVKALANMPSMDELRAMLVGVLANPASRLVQVLSGTQKSLVSVLSNKIEKGD